MSSSTRLIRWQLWRAGPACIAAVLLGLVVNGCGKIPADSPEATVPPDDQPQYVSQELPPVFTGHVESLSSQFEVVNLSPDARSDLETKPSCACSEARLEKTALQPKEKTTLHLEANLRGRTGPQTFFCRILSKQGFLGHYEFHTTVYPEIAFDPSSLEFGVIQPEKEAKTEFAISYHHPSGQPAPKLLSLVPASPDLKISESGRSEASIPGNVQNRQINYQLSLSPQKTAGRGLSQLVATFDVEGVRRQLTVPVSWSMNDFFVLSPNRAFFGVIKKSDKPACRKVILRRGDGSSFSVVNVVAPKDRAVNWKTISSGGPQKIHMFEIQIEPAKTKGSVWGELIVETDCAPQSKTRIPYSALIEQSPTAASSHREN